MVPLWDYLMDSIYEPPKRNYYGAYGYKFSSWPGLGLGLSGLFQSTAQRCQGFQCKPRVPKQTTASVSCANDSLAV